MCVSAQADWSLVPGPDNAAPVLMSTLHRFTAVQRCASEPEGCRDAGAAHPFGEDIDARRLLSPGVLPVTHAVLKYAAHPEEHAACRGQGLWCLIVQVPCLACWGPQVQMWIVVSLQMAEEMCHHVIPVLP